MLRSRFPTAHHFTIGLFGCQYHADTPSPAKLELIEKFDALINNACIAVEHLEQNDIPSKIWMSYWESPQKFKAWFESDATAAFWDSLPEDAGFWRETVNLPATRAMYEGTAKYAQGFGHCGELIPLTSKTGYWGAYRSRMTPDFEGDAFASPLDSLSKPPATNEIRQGRIRMSKFPDNLCMVVEGQDYSFMKQKERDFWNENFDGLTKKWVTTVVTTSPENGMANARACHAFAGVKQLGATNGSANGETNGTPNGIFPGLDYIRQAQILFWQDLAPMEHIGRWDKNHVKLRRSFMEAYGPDGPMHGGDLLLWVDMGILKANELDAEYIGCYDGTGFSAFAKHEGFDSEKVTKSKLPAFFDEPIPSKPIEW
ncbi:phenylacetaldoxime dehydratase [Fusarium austroafricanum]|uniref:Phenylacetaldoxime dehydratase n=1 Tax=Fusarium austroafricanum TaxID=2364996 RepID=A0A8H4JPP1_9HYPO|nr:phenylacetaldoxime dehydratase [Fusarium austroafricanum]